MKVKEKASICQIATCKRPAKYLLKWEGQWLDLCTQHERHFGTKNLEKLGLPKREIDLIMSNAYWEEQ